MGGRRIRLAYGVMDWLSLALLSAFSLASADAVTKKKLAHYSPSELVMVRFGFCALALWPILLVEPLPQLPLAFWGWMAALLPLEILAMLLYMRAIRDSPLSLTLPYLAFTPVFAVLPGAFVLGERLSPRGVAGILLVVTGAYFLNAQHAAVGRPNTWIAPLQAVWHERGSRLMLTVAVIYSVTSVLGKGALQYVPPQTFGPFYFALLGPLAVVVAGAREPRAVQALWRRPGWNVAVGLLMAVMVLAHFLAIAEVEVAYMIAVKRASLLFGILYGALLFGEQRLAQHLLAGSLMVGGVALIAASSSNP